MVKIGYGLGLFIFLLFAHSAAAADQNLEPALDAAGLHPGRPGSQPGRAGGRGRSVRG